MARRLLGAGMEVGVWSRHPTTTVPLVNLGATPYEKVTDAVSGASVVITMLPTAEALSDVMFDGSALRAMSPDSTWIQMATIGVVATERMDGRSQVDRPDVAFVDAPVSGSRQPAESGQLLILASGPERARTSIDPVFGVLGRETLWLGAAGAGSRMKLVLNTWLAFQTEGAAEAAALAERLGVAAPSVFAALQDNALASPYALAKLTRMVDEDYRPDFALEWALKDLDLVASDAGTEAAPVAAVIADRWRGLVRDGASGLDVSAARLGLGEVASTAN